MAQPGQEIRVVITDDGTIGGGSQDSQDVSGKISPDVSGKISPDVSGKISPDVSGKISPDVSGKISPDTAAQNPFGFPQFQPGFSPTPITVVARRGQEIRIIVPNQSGSSGT
jgi:hypothetical protein